jgi:CheY-like chemotaxis protein
MDMTPIEILLVEDNPGDVRLTIEAFKATKIQNNLHVAEDGIEAMAFVREKPPNLILLDINLPKMNGHQVLAEIKTDERLKHIPVVVLSTSAAEQDILESYKHHANCYITKPIDFSKFIEVAQAIETFWISLVTLPPNDSKWQKDTM